MADYKQITSFIRKWEGGLSKSKTDTASSYPVPDGTGYHTNKGITWKTFERLAPKLGYKATPQLFYAMPDEIWGKIFKHGYWDVIRGDEIKSQAIADTLVDFAWNAGPGRAIEQLQKYVGLRPSRRMDDGTLLKINITDEQALHAGFSEHKKAWYKGLKNQQANQAGWTNRLNDLYTVTKEKLGKLGTGKTILLVGFGLGMLMLGISYLNSK